MSEAAQKMREAIQKEMSKEVEDVVKDGNEEINEEKEPVIQPSEAEIEAQALGWNPEGKDRDGNTLSPEEFLARKPLFNKIKNQGEELTKIKETLKEIKADSFKQAKASLEEKEELLKKLEAAKETALDNLNVDDVRKIDKQMKDVEKDIAKTAKAEPVDTGTESPAYQDFLKDNEWAADEKSSLYKVGMLIGKEYMDTGKVASDKDLYDHIAARIREDFPEKFKAQPAPTSKVASAANRSTTNYASKKKMSLSDIPDETTRRIVENMARQTGKSVEDYLKNRTPDDFK